MEPDPDSLTVTINQLATIPATDYFSFTVLIIFLLLLLIIFSAAQTAYMSIWPRSIADLKKSEERVDILLLKLLDKPASLRATLNTSTTLLIVSIVILSDHVLFILFPHDWLIARIAPITLVLILLGIFVPKVLVLKHRVAYARFMVYPMVFIDWLLTPLTFLLINFARLINSLLKHSWRFSPEELNRLDDSALINEENEEERLILKGIANFGNISVRQVMKSRTEVVAFDIEMSLEQLLIRIKEAGYSRIPVYEKSFDSIKGVLYVKDIMMSNRSEPGFKWQKLIRIPYFVPESKKIDDLLREFQSRRIHMAIVVDEYGGTSGIATLEDVIEEIVGEINDEFDEVDDELKYSKLDASTYVFEGKTALNDLYRLMKLEDAPFDEVRGEADTLGGLISQLGGRIMHIGEYVEYKNFRFTVESADKRRVKRVKITFE